jgi:hypothetical protein
MFENVYNILPVQPNYNNIFYSFQKSKHYFQINFTAQTWYVLAHTNHEILTTFH